MQIFDENQLRQHRLRAVSLQRDFQDDVLITEMATRLVDRLHEVRRSFCDVFLDGQFGRAPLPFSLAAADPFATCREGPLSIETAEGRKPLGEGTKDLILSCLNLQWTNDLPGMLAQIRRTLKPDGLFMAVLWGAETLGELRHALLETEMAMSGGVSTRVSPMLTTFDAAALMQRAGFALPVVDTQRLTLTYPSLHKLVQDLRTMGETAAFHLASLCRPTTRSFWTEAEEHYKQAFGLENGRIQATYQAIFLTGWGPSPTQPKPLRRGSGEVCLKDILQSSELIKGKGEDRVVL